MPVTVSKHRDGETLHGRMHRLLSDVDEFETRNFGFLTPQEALEEYRSSYDSRFNGYLGRALGRFLSLIPGDRYR